MIRDLVLRGTSLVGLSALVSLSGIAHAGEWRITPRAEIRQGFTDNVFLTERNRKSDFFTTLSPGIGVTGEGGRVKLSFDYSLNYDAYLREDSINGFRQNLIGTGTAELLQNNLFVDVGAFAGQSPGLARGQVSAVERRLPGNNTTQTYSYNVSPYWRSRFGSWASTEARYRFTQVFSRSNSSQSVNNANTVSDSNVHQVSGSVTSGENFNRLRWRLGTDNVETRRADDNNSTVQSIDGSSATLRRNTVDFQPSYVVNRWLSLLGTVGYERIESGNTARDLSGEFWNTGFRLTPSERTSFELTYGKRYNGDNWASSFSTASDSGTSVSFSYREAVENQALQAANGLAFLTTDPVTGTVIDARTGRPFTGRDPNFDQSDSTFLTRSFVLSVRLPRERDSYFATAQRTIRDSDINGVSAGSGRSDTTTGGTLGWEHKLTPSATSVATLSYTDVRTDSGSSTVPDGTNKTLSAQVNLNYDLNETLKATVGYAHIRRDVTGPQFFSNEFVGNYSENVLFVTLRKTF
jgi:uncharacterized protein (PEP-CTERM system associated)